MSKCILDNIASTQIWGPDAEKGFMQSLLRLDVGVEPGDGFGIPSNVAEASLFPIFYNSSIANYQHESDWFLANGSLVDGRVSNSFYSPAYFPYPRGMKLEGPSDRHGIVLDPVNCKLYESWVTVDNGASYTVANTAAFDLNRVLPHRPDGWTSADAAGLPIYPGILKYAEIASGEITHALRFTIETVADAYAFPATKGGTSTNVLQGYYGARFRLRSDFDITPYHNDTKVLLRALKKYGLILADQGSTAFISGDNHQGYDIGGLLADLNSGTPASNKRIAFNHANWDMVQNPGPVTYGFSASPTCQSRNSNDSPFVPDFNPVECNQVPISPAAPYFIPVAPFAPVSPPPPSEPSAAMAPSANEPGSGSSVLSHFIVPIFAWGLMLGLLM
jgi:hypothetical protein